MCLDTITPKSNAWFCFPVAQVHEKDGRWHHGGFRDHRAGEHRVPHAVVESDSLEVLVNFGSIDNVSHAPRLTAPPETVRSRALCLACHPLRLCCDHLTYTRDRFSCFRRPASVRKPSFSSWKRSCSGVRPAASSSGSSAASNFDVLLARNFMQHVMAIEFSMVYRRCSGRGWCAQRLSGSAHRSTLEHVFLVSWVLRCDRCS